MAVNAATEGALGRLHAQLAKVFCKVLEKYEADLSALESIDRDKIEEDMLSALMEIKEPNPAMLSAISKFLKDNDIGVDSQALEDLNSTARRLEERREARKKAGLSLHLVPHVEAM